jgi:hypothetical protein
MGIYDEDNADDAEDAFAQDEGTLADAYLAEHPPDSRRYRCGCPIQPVVGHWYNFCRTHHAVLVDAVPVAREGRGQ